MKDHAQKPLALVILDGWGFSNNGEPHPVDSAHTPVYDQIREECPSTSLAAVRGADTGHLRLGTGRVVRSDADRIRSAIECGAFASNAILKDSFTKLAVGGGRLHLVGLVSDAGRESSPATLDALLEAAKGHKVRDVSIHCILDGKDSLPGTAPDLIAKLQNKLKDIDTGTIASICGRFYGMDTRGNWERTARAFTMLVHADGGRVGNAEAAVRTALARGISEEFLAPMVVAPDGESAASIRDNDTVVFFNHRPDGLRQLASSLASSVLGEQKVEILCLTDYDVGMGAKVLFPQEEQANVLTEVISSAGTRVCRITESERTPHITYYFDGGAHGGNSGDREFHIPSINPQKFEMRPEGGSFRIADRVRRELQLHPGFFVINFPAADLTARTGNFDSTIESVQFVDTCLGGVLEYLLGADGTAIITSSHAFGSSAGSQDAMLVPCHFVGPELKGTTIRDDGTLEDIAPTILGLLGIEKPPEMTGTDLRII